MALPASNYSKRRFFSTVSTLWLFSSTSLACGFSYESNPMKFYFLHGSLQQNSSSVFPYRLHGKPHCITARHWIHDSNGQMFWAAE